MLNLTIAKYHPSGGSLEETWWKGNGACNSVCHFVHICDSINLSPAEIYQTSTGKYIKWQFLPISLKRETDSAGQWWIHIWWVKGDRKNPCPLVVLVVSIEMGEVRR